MMCRWVVAIGLVGLFFSCSSRKHMVAHYREESCKTVEAAFRDTLKQRHVEQEQEQTFWDIEMVREWVDTADSLAPRPACPDKTVERWRIKAASSKVVQRVDSLEKVKKLKALIQATHSHTLIEIDGGVNFETGRELVTAGADALVAGSFVFKSEDPEATIAGLKNLKTE